MFGGILGGFLGGVKKKTKKSRDRRTKERTNQALLEGREQGEKLTGISSEEVGRQRAGVRQEYKDIVAGKSIVGEEMRRDRNASARRLKAMQMGGNAPQGGVAEASQRQLDRQSSSDIALAREQEYMNALGKLEKQYRGAASDIARLEGQYGSIAIGAKPAPQPSQNKGLFGMLFG